MLVGLLLLLELLELVGLRFLLGGLFGGFDVGDVGYFWWGELFELVLELFDRLGKHLLIGCLGLLELVRPRMVVIIY